MSTYHNGCEEISGRLDKQLPPFHPRRPRGSWWGQNEVNRAEIVAAKVFYKGVRAPGKRVSPDHFQAALRMLAPD